MAIVDQDQMNVMGLLKQLGETVLRQRIAITELEGRIGRLEHVVTFPGVPTSAPRTAFAEATVTL